MNSSNATDKPTSPPMPPETISSSPLPYGEQGFKLGARHVDPELEHINTRIQEVLYSTDNSERKVNRLVNMMVRDYRDDDDYGCAYFWPIVALVWEIRPEHPWQDVLLQALRQARRLENVSRLYRTGSFNAINLC